LPNYSESKSSLYTPGGSRAQATTAQTIMSAEANLHFERLMVRALNDHVSGSKSSL
jgi:hypothetical protein